MSPYEHMFIRKYWNMKIDSQRYPNSNLLMTNILWIFLTSRSSTVVLADVKNSSFTEIQRQIAEMCAISDFVCEKNKMKQGVEKVAK